MKAVGWIRRKVTSKCLLTSTLSSIFTAAARPTFHHVFRTIVGLDYRRYPQTGLPVNVRTRTDRGYFSETKLTQKLKIENNYFAHDMKT